MRGDRKRVIFSIKTILFLAILIGLSVWQYQNTYISNDDGAQEKYGFYQEYIDQFAALTKEERNAQLETLTTKLEESIEAEMAKEQADEQMITKLFLRQSALKMEIDVLFWGSIISVCLLYGARAVTGVLFFGKGSWNLPVQCSSLFESCTLSVSMWQMIALIFVFHIASAFASALVSLFFCILIRQEKIAVLVCLGIAIIESILYKSISANSSLILIRIFNIAALWNIQEVMYGYQNVPIGTIPVGQYTSYIVYISILILVCACTIILLGSRRHPKGAASLSERLMELIGKAASRFVGAFPPIFSEWRKLLFFEHGFLLLLLFGWFVYTMFGAESVLYMYSDSGIKDGIYSQIEGMEIHDAVSWLDETIQTNNSDLAKLAQAQEDYNNKKIGYEQWDAIRQKYRNASLYAAAYDDLQIELTRIWQLSEKTNKTIHVVSPFGAEELAGKLNLLEAFDNAKYQKRLLWCFYELIILVFLFAGVFPHENKTKMARILIASPKGRRILNRRKCRMERWTVVFLWLAGSIMQFRQIIISGGSFHGLFEPAAAVSVFAKFPVWISFGAALAGVCVLRLILLLSVCGILMGIGSKCRNTAQTAAIGAIFVLVPSGLEYLFSFRFFPLSMLDAIQNLWTDSTGMLIESAALVVAGAVGYFVAEYSKS